MIERIAMVITFVGIALVGLGLLLCIFDSCW